jgi:hypothetical protein
MVNDCSISGDLNPNETMFLHFLLRIDPMSGGVPPLDGRSEQA